MTGSNDEKHVLCAKKGFFNFRDPAPVTLVDEDFFEVGILLEFFIEERIHRLSIADFPRADQFF